jgi:phosphomannomutase
MAWDPNAASKSEVQALLDEKNVQELGNKFNSRVEFGTAGIRGQMSSGPACMNDLVVIQCTQGLCKYIQQDFPEAASKGVVIGYDHRGRDSHSSMSFAENAAAVFISQGIPVYFLTDLVCTPLVPAAIQQLGAAAGIMITASHNPKEDNGYKVYWGNGAQIISPHDTGVGGDNV